MSGCPNLKELRLSFVTFTYQEFHSLISNFPLLEVLDLDTCELERITISSNILKCLSINYCYKLKAIDIDTPNLVSFIYKRNQIPEFSINAPCPWYVEFANKKAKDSPGYEIIFDLDTSWFLKMKGFLEESNQIEFLTLKIWSAKNSFSFEEFIQSSASLPCKVGTLYLQIDEPQSNYEAMLDGVFAICNPRILSIMKREKYDNNFIEWLFEKLINKDSNCCESLHV
ncbi:hypothetical protein QYF36_016724 [Acer negundo]|nr:hypothetical protein QYF36_016724 [Acer negundo]